VSDALLLNAGASWAAYQVGAIEQLIGERRMRFDTYVGCGIGAMHAALLACGAGDRIGPFWDTLSTWKLIRPNLRSPWKVPARNTPQRRFVAELVSERALAATGCTLAITTFDLMTGEEVVHRYPGDAVPIVDAVMAAVATPGLLAPLVSGDRMLVEATMIDSVPLAAIPTDPAPRRVVAVLAGIPLDRDPARRHTTWRAVALRSIEVNLAHDSRRAIERAADETRWRADAAALLTDVADLAGDDAGLSAALGAAVEPLRGSPPPDFVWITPSERLGYPLWRFPRRAMQEARQLGRVDAAKAAL
jgi:predicted acylesterase/phospholipase RssA